MIEDSCIPICFEARQASIDRSERGAEPLGGTTHEAFHALEVDLHSMFQTPFDLRCDVGCNLGNEFLSGWIDHGDDGLIVDSRTQY